MIRLAVVLALSIGLRPAPVACDVVAVYRRVEAPRGTLAVLETGRPEPLVATLVPTTLAPGRSVVTLADVALDLYRVDGGALYVRTTFCYDRPVGATRATLDVGAGTGVGTLTFHRD